MQGAAARPEYKTLERIRVRDPWFEVYRVSPRVFAIYEPHQYEETIGYLIVLPRLVAAIEAVRAGKIPAEPQEGGKAIYRVDDISFLLRAGPQGVH